ncbi:MAG: hypothetical protein ACRD0K_03480 [Egibacteraceae bacterium]
MKNERLVREIQERTAMLGGCRADHNGITSRPVNLLGQLVGCSVPLRDEADLNVGTKNAA